MVCVYMRLMVASRYHRHNSESDACMPYLVMEHTRISMLLIAQCMKRFSMGLVHYQLAAFSCRTEESPRGKKKSKDGTGKLRRCC